MVRIAVPKEREVYEPRVALTPDLAGRLTKEGHHVALERGAGESSGFADSRYEDAGVSLTDGYASTTKDAEVLLCVRRPGPDALPHLARGMLVIGLLDPHGAQEALVRLAETGATAFGIELLPRITRAQSMDVLSSQANLAGYRAIIDAAAEFSRALPMMITAAGTVPAARVFVMGAGVAGLQAIATARRLGAVVSATDVRPATKEQVSSLGAKFIAVENDEFRQAESARGYAKPMSETYREAQAELIERHIVKQDIVITTALIPGRPAPELINRKMVESMAPGSVIADLAVERGGNCALSAPGKTVVHGHVKILGHVNWPGRVATSASALYAKNLLGFLETLIDKDSCALDIDWDDALVQATNLARDGKIVHPDFLSTD